MLLFTNSQLQVIILLWITVQYNTAPAAATDTCSIEGLPEHTQRRGNVYFTRYDVPSVDLTLQCRCSVNTPTWVQYRLHNDTFTDALPRIVYCVKNGEDCSPKSYILPSHAAPGYYVYQNYTFHIHEPTVLLCSSTNEKLTVVVSIQVFQDHSTTTGNHTTDTTNTTVTDYVQKPCLPTPSTIINTIHNTAGSDSTDATSTVTILMPSIITTTTQPSTTSTVQQGKSVTVEKQTKAFETPATSITTTSTAEQAIAVSKSLSHDPSTYVTPIVVIGEVTDKASNHAFGTTTFIFLGLTSLLVILNIVLIVYIMYIKKTHIKVVKEFQYLVNDVSRRSSADPLESSECGTNDQQLSPTHSNSEV